MTEIRKNIKTGKQKNGLTDFSVFRFLSLSVFLFSVFCSPSSEARASIFNKQDQILARVFYLPTCKACHKVMEDIIPSIAKKYGLQVRWEYIDITSGTNLRDFASLEEKLDRKLGTPTILIGNKVLVGVTAAADSLDQLISEELSDPNREIMTLGEGKVSLLERFRSFGPFTVIGAGLVDGFNPCAFTVIVFFISFLTLMGYRRREMALIGSFYITAVFLTYLALGLGLFKAFYAMKGFYIFSKVTYMVIGTLSIFLGALAIKDYIIFKKTGNTDAMALQLPRLIKNKIHSIVGEYYRKDKTGRQKAFFGLALSALLVGFMISLLEAVCTGQLYLPTIVFVLKEGSLRARALFYLIIYNIMFILPLVLVLLAALGGTTSKQFEAYARRHLGIVKLTMAAVFFALGVVLWRGI
jgi:cytochrome c biogenesis protein CcdA